MLLKFLHALAIVYQMNGVKYYYLIKKRSFDQKYKFSNKNEMVGAWRIFQKNLVAYLLVMATGLSRPGKSREGPGTGRDRT